MTQYYVDPVSGSNSDTGGLGDPWLTVAHGYPLIADDDFLNLFDSFTDYVGDNQMITFIGGHSGSSGHPRTIRALNDGMVLIEGEDARVPVTVSDSWWNFEGFNGANSLHDVVLMAGSNNNFRRCGFWDANVSENAYVVSVFYPSDTVLFEDCVGFGTGRKIMGSTAGAVNTTFRRCFCMWNGSTSTAGPKQVMTLCYDSYGNTAENCIGTRDEDIDPGEGDSIGIFSVDRTTGSDYDMHCIYNGCIGFYLASQTVRESPNGILPGASSQDYFEWRDTAIWLAPGFHGDVTVINSPAFNGNGGGAGQPYQIHASGGNRRYTNLTVVGSERADTVDTSSPDGWTLTNLNYAASVLAAYGAQSLWENDGTKGATIRYQIVDGVTTPTPLFPWPMNQRIIDMLTFAGRTPIDIDATMTLIWGAPPDITPGADPPTDNFDAYTVATDLSMFIGGTGTWLGGYIQGEAGAMTVETAPSGGQGGKAVRSNSAAGSGTYYYRQFAPVSTGTFKWEQRISITNPNDAQTGMSFHEAGVGMRCHTHFSGTGDIEAYDFGTSAWVTVLASYSADTWYRMELEIDLPGHPSQYRVRANEGTWTAWIGANGTMTAINLEQFNDFASNAHTLWFDALGATFPPPAGIPVDDFDSYTVGVALESQTPAGLRWSGGWTKVSGGDITAELAPAGMLGNVAKSTQ